MQEANRRKDEELKAARAELEKVRKALGDEEQLKQREKTIMLQKDNKLKLLEAKIGGKVEAKIDANKQKPILQKLIVEGPATE